MKLKAFSSRFSKQKWNADSIHKILCSIEILYLSDKGVRILHCSICDILNQYWNVKYSWVIKLLKKIFCEDDNSVLFGNNFCSKFFQLLCGIKCCHFQRMDLNYTVREIQII